MTVRFIATPDMPEGIDAAWLRRGSVMVIRYRPGALLRRGICGQLMTAIGCAVGKL